MTALLEAVRLTLESAGLYTPDARLMCGVSGGCDSVALLRALCEVRRTMPFQLYALHVQHALRAEASAEDERFVRALCEELDVPCIVEHAGLTGSMADPGIETLARDRRRAIFHRQMEQLRLDAVLLAHHRDDQAETVLMHLLRGSGMEGLCGMKPVAPFGPGLVLRPFLSLTKEQLRAASGPCREDESNFETLTPRNALRLDILPRLEALFPGASAHLAGTAETLAAEEQFLSKEADDCFRQALYAVPPLYMLSRSVLAGFSPAMVRRVLRRWWQEGVQLAGVPSSERSLSREDTLMLASMLTAAAGTQCNLPGGLAVRAGREHLHLMYQTGEPLHPVKPFEIPFSPGGSVLPHLTVRQAQTGTHPPCTAEEIVLTPEVLSLNPVWRSIRPGDRIHPFGAPGSKPLRRFLTDRGMDLPIRQALTVLAAGSDILWIPSVCTSEQLRLVSIPDGSLRLTGVHSFFPLIMKE